MNNEHLVGPWALFFEGGQANSHFVSVASCVAGLAALTDFADELAPRDALYLLRFGVSGTNWKRDSLSLDNSRAWAKRLGL